MRYAYLGVFAWMAAASTAWGASATLAVRPSVIVGAPGALVDVPITISSANRVSVIRLTMDYDTNGATFQDVRVGSDAQAAGFTIAAVNSNLAFAPETPNTNENLLVLTMSGSSTWITGTNKQLLILTFRLATGTCKRSPLNFDADCTHTDGSTFEGDYLCGSSLLLRNGVMANGCTTDAADGGAPAFTLFQNAPNPFNPTTRISMQLREPGPVVLQVFGVDGLLVRVLLDTSLPAGPHEAVWDGRDGRGRRVPSGVYFYQLRAGDAVESHPMVLVQ